MRTICEWLISTTPVNLFIFSCLLLHLFLVKQNSVFLLTHCTRLFLLFHFVPRFIFSDYLSMVSVECLFKFIMDSFHGTVTFFYDAIFYDCSNLFCDSLRFRQSIRLWRRIRECDRNLSFLFRLILSAKAERKTIRKRWCDSKGFK